MRKEKIRDLAESIHLVEGFDPKHYLTPSTTPVVSIYIPTKHTEREERRDEWNKIEFKNLANEAKRTLQEKYPEHDIKPIENKLTYILDHEDLPLWIDSSAGLGFLISANDVFVFNLSYAPKSCVTVGEKYYLKPLIHNMQLDMNYKMLLLNSDFFSVLDGDYNGVSFKPYPDDVKAYFAETFPEFDGETTALDYYSLEDHMSPYHNHKSRNEVVAGETEKFFRYVNKALNDHIAHDDDTPIILVALPEHDSEFRKIATFKQLLPVGIKKDATTMTGDELRDGARDIMASIQNVKIDELIEKYAYQASKGNATDNIPDIGMALAQRKVAVLFLAENKSISGTFNPDTGDVSCDTLAESIGDKQLDPSSPDIANAFAQATIAQDGEVVILPADKMPNGATIAALYRY